MASRSSTSAPLLLLSFVFLLLLLLLHSANPNPSPNTRRAYSRRPIRFAEELIGDLNLLPGIEEVEGGDAIEGFSSPRLVERRLRLPILGDIGSEISVEQLGHHAGYYRLEHTHGARYLIPLLILCFFDSDERHRLVSSVSLM